MGVKSTFFKIGAFSALFVGAGLGWSLYESRHPKVREYSVPILPEGKTPLTILHISDLHFRGKKSAWLKKWLSNLDISGVDLVVSTGDNLGAVDVEDEVIEVLQPFLALPGVFVFGSNDYYAPKKKNPLKYFFIKSPIKLSNYSSDKKSVAKKMLNFETLRTSFIESGWLDLNNNRGVLDLPQGRVEFIGVDDPHLGLDSFDYSVDFCGESTQSSDGVIVRIGVAHAPYLNIIEQFEKRGCALSCFGHTHGGQLCVPLFGALVSNCDLPPVFASGFFSVKDIFSYVKEVFVGYGNKVLTDKVYDYKGFVSISAGLGASPMLPLRFACAPAVSYITLVPKSWESC